MGLKGLFSLIFCIGLLYQVLTLTYPKVRIPDMSQTYPTYISNSIRNCSHNVPRISQVCPVSHTCHIRILNIHIPSMSHTSSKTCLKHQNKHVSPTLPGLDERFGCFFTRLNILHSQLDKPGGRRRESGEHVKN